VKPIIVAGAGDHTKFPGGKLKLNNSLTLP
jgi:hypothetical protein